MKLWDKLDHYYRIVKSTLLLYRSPTAGLFRTKTCGDDQKAKIHDSLYCTAVPWALALVYRHIDDDKGRTHELEHSGIKCMRGIVYCYMRQADKEDSIRGSRFNPILDMLAAFKKGVVGGVKVHVDRLQTLISGAVVEQLDFLRISDTEELPEFKSFEELEVPKHSKVKRQSSTSNAPEQEQQPDVPLLNGKTNSPMKFFKN
ncbi:hypothetical protein J1605_007926 [Eschrichtius robustus]|uniref:Phosphorylase b kinase regulatory subunit n=1 Tax=Eschrichtius robustus TaxID=9764 RepID=A0AB34H1L6_ESCRO|nr:hypothetical protein J1605_007926 [Eschrichtius robustus]